MDAQTSDIYEQLITSGLRFVSFRPRSEKEIRDFLARKLKRRHTTAPLVVREVLDRLRVLGYVDDAKFTAWWVEQRTGRKPKGRRLIERELLQKGIVYEAKIDEKQLAKRAIAKKQMLWKKLPQLERKKKISDFLYRRGFDWETIASIVDEVVKKEYNTASE
jgi:regulatory protein